MPIENYSVVNPSTQQKTFTENNICRFSVPFNSIPFFDPHQSYLQFLIEASATDKLELNGDGSVCIKYLRLSCNGIVLEEIDEYNQLCHLYNVYGEDDSSRAHASVFTQNSENGSVPGLMGNQSANVVAGEKRVKVIVPLKCSGLFSSMEVVPLMALGNNLDIEIRFAPNTEVVKTYQRTSGLPTGVEGRVPQVKTIVPCADLVIANGANVITGAQGAAYTLTLPYKGWSSVGDIPFQVGECVELLTVVGADSGADTPFVGAGGANAEVNTNFIITAIARTQTANVNQSPNAISITIGTTDGLNAVTNGTGGGVTVVALKKSRPTNIVAGNPVAVAPLLNSLTYSNVELYFQKVTPPQQYVESLSKQIQSADGFAIDLHTWTTYKTSLLTGVRSQTIEIPAFQSRAKSVLCVTRVANQNPTLNVDNVMPNPEVAARPRYDFDGKHQGLQDYQWQVNNGIRQPTRPVDLTVMNGNMNHLSAEHLIQITQALGASNIGVKSIDDAKDSWCMGRALSKYGGTSNLTSALRVYLNYTADTDPVANLQPITFLNHINRVQVNAQGLQVFS